MKTITLLICAMTVLSVCGSAGGEEPAYKFDLAKRAHSKPTDSVSILRENEHTGFLITNSFGIGSVTISLASGRWPAVVVLRFRYEENRGFKRLEGLTITTSKILIQGGMGTSGKMPFFLADADGKFKTSEMPAGEMVVAVTERDGAMEVSLPPNLFAGSQAVKIEWVDAYR